MLYRPPVPADIDELNALILTSKAHHGYDADFMQACEDELRLTPAHLAAGHMCCAVDGERMAGMVELREAEGDLHIEKLFVHPDYMGRGIGTRLMEWVETRARLNGCFVLLIDSDPGAASFYERLGAVKVGDVPSGSVTGRTLPRYEFRLDTD